MTSNPKLGSESSDARDCDRALHETLSEEVSDARIRKDAALDVALADFGHRLVLFGAGNFGRQALERLRARGVEPLAFSDNNSRLWGTQIDGVLVLSPEEVPPARLVTPC